MFIIININLKINFYKLTIAFDKKYYLVVRNGEARNYVLEGQVSKSKILFRYTLKKFKLFKNSYFK